MIASVGCIPTIVMILMLVIIIVAIVLVRKVVKAQSTPIRIDPTKRAIGHIPEFEYVTQSGETFVTIKQVKQYHSESELESFVQWMNGQTCGVAGIYSSDYERWLRQGKRTQQSKDWD